MELKEVFFYLISAFTLTTGLLAVTARQIFRSAIFLLFCMMGVAGIYFWMDYEFIAAVQIVVYVGGIVVLIIFSIFLTQKVGKDLPPPQEKRILFSGLACVFAFTWFWLSIKKNDFFINSHIEQAVTVKRIGNEMINYGQGGFVLPFEVVSMLLLSAMVGCIVIALKTDTTKTEVAQK